MFSFNDLVTPVTKDEAKASVYDVLGIVGTDVTSWKPGAVARTIITAWAIGLSSLSQLQALIARSGFLELSSGNWLTLVAYYVYGVTRQEATFATGEVTLTNTGGGSFPGEGVDDRTFTNSTTGKSYRNSEGFDLDPLGTVTIPVVAIEAGAASTSVPGAVDEIETTMIGVTVSNTLAIVGSDAESDSLLRARCYEKLGALSPNGPWDAYSYIARQTKRPDGTPIGVTRVRVTKDGFGKVDVYCATPTGGVASVDVAYLEEALQQNATPLCVTLDTHGAENVVFNVSYAVKMYNTSGLTEQQIKDAIAAKLASFFSSHPVGGNVVDGVGRVYADAIGTVIGSALPQIMSRQVLVPSTDTILGVGQVPVLGNVTGTITQVAPPDGGLV